MAAQQPEVAAGERRLAGALTEARKSTGRPWRFLGRPVPLGTRQRPGGWRVPARVELIWTRGACLGAALKRENPAVSGAFKVGDTGLEPAERGAPRSDLALQRHSGALRSSEIRSEWDHER